MKLYKDYIEALNVTIDNINAFSKAIKYSYQDVITLQDDNTLLIDPEFFDTNRNVIPLKEFKGLLYEWMFEKMDKENFDMYMSICLNN